MPNLRLFKLTNPLLALFTFQGAHHDRGTLNNCAETGDTYRYGYRDTEGKFRSIMAYGCASNQCDNVPVIPGDCERVLLFSNPTTGYEYFDSTTQSTIRRPIGDARQNNVRQLNNQRIGAAGWYPAMDCSSDAECNDQDATTSDTCDTVNRVCVFTPSPPTPVSVPGPLPVSAPVPVPQPKPAPLPVSAPVLVPRPGPVPVPRPVPMSVPVIAPVPISVPVPVSAPMLAPVPATAPVTRMEGFVVSGLSDSWRTVSLNATYTSAVPVCSQQMDQLAGMSSAVVRIQNIGPRSFEIKLQSAAAAPKTIQARDVHCIVVEKGRWLLPNGRKIEAQKFLSTVTANKNTWPVQNVTYLNSYSTAPAVLGSVISTNDPKWSVFMAQGSGDRKSRPTNTALSVSKLTGEDYSTRVSEMLGIVVVETGHLTSLTTEIEVGRSGVVAFGYVDAVRSNTFKQAFPSAPTILVVSQVGQTGADGSWAVARDPPQRDLFRPAVDEDTVSDTERNHSAEAMDYFALSVAGTLPLTPA